MSFDGATNTCRICLSVVHYYLTVLRPARLGYRQNTHTGWLLIAVLKLTRAYNSVCVRAVSKNPQDLCTISRYFELTIQVLFCWTVCNLNAPTSASCSLFCGCIYSTCFADNYFCFIFQTIRLWLYGTAKMREYSGIFADCNLGLFYLEFTCVVLHCVLLDT